MNEKLLEILTEDVLFEAMKKCFRGVLWKDIVAYFQLNWPTEIDRLRGDIREGSYKQRKPSYFKVGNRDIMGIAFRDRVLQRALNDLIVYPAISKTLVAGNCACQEDKGTEYACEYLKKMIRREWRNNGTRLYAWKFDIKGYYKNLPHDTGEKELKRVLLDFVFDFIQSKVLSVYSGDTGYTAGNQTIQIIGISALSPLDHFIKEQLRVKSYVRYMDDFIIIHHDKAFLYDCKTAIEEELAHNGLSLNYKKTQFVDLQEDGIDFLGYTFRLADNGKVFVSVATHKTKQKRIELARMASKVQRGEKTRESADQAYMDYRPHVQYGDTEHFLRRMDEYYFGLYGEEVPDYVKNSTKSKKRKRNGAAQSRERGTENSTPGTE